jgi:hypothetical protein
VRHVGSHVTQDLTGIDYIILIVPTLIALFGWVALVLGADRRPGARWPGHQAGAIRAASGGRPMGHLMPLGESVSAAGAVDGGAPGAGSALADSASTDTASADTELAGPDARGRISARADQQNKD